VDLQDQMDNLQVQGLVESFTTSGLVVWSIDGQELRVKFSNRIARETLGHQLNLAPRSDLDRLLRAAMLKPGEEMRAEVKDLVHATSGEKFGLLARVFGLSSSLVCAHIYTADFPLVLVGEPDKDKDRDVVAMAVAAVDPLLFGRNTRQQVQRAEQMIGGAELDMPHSYNLSFDRLDGGSLNRLSLEFLLQGSRGSSDMLEALPCPSMEWDGSGRCCSANKGLRALLGAASDTKTLEFADAFTCVDEAQHGKVRSVLAHLTGVSHDMSVQQSLEVTLNRVDGSVVGATLALSKPSTTSASAHVICVQVLL
jgi:PAS domain-containing protein